MKNGNETRTVHSRVSSKKHHNRRYLRTPEIWRHRNDRSGTRPKSDDYRQVQSEDRDGSEWCSRPLTNRVIVARPKICSKTFCRAAGGRSATIQMKGRKERISRPRRVLTGTRLLADEVVATKRFGTVGVPSGSTQHNPSKIRRTLFSRFKVHR